MSKRYGRNQRRKHREAIADLKQSCVHLSSMVDKTAHTNVELATEVERLKNHIRHWNEEIKEVIGEWSGFMSEPVRADVQDWLREVNVEPPIQGVRRC